MKNLVSAFVIKMIAKSCVKFSVFLYVNLQFKFTLKSRTHDVKLNFLFPLAWFLRWIKCTTKLNPSEKIQNVMCI